MLQEQDYPGYYGYEDEEIAEDEIETLYVVIHKEDPRKPFWQNWKFPRFDASKIINRFMQVVAILLLSGFVVVPDMPRYNIASITLPAIFLPLQQLKTSVPIIPTGHKTIPATRAHGYLTFYNGSAFIQSLQAGFVLTTSNGIEVSTDSTVTIPALNSSTTPPTLGTVTVSSHAVVAGSNGNIQAYAINQTYAGTIFVKNLAPFVDGRDSHTETYATKEDVSKALATGRQQLTTKQATEKQPGMLFQPCTESVKQADLSLSLTWSCQYVTFKSPVNAQIMYIRVVGRNIVVTVKTIQPLR